MNLPNFLKGILRSTLNCAIALGILLPLIASAQPQGLTTHNPKVKEVIAVQDQFTKSLMAQPEILGTAAGQAADGEICLVIYVNKEAKNHGEVMRALPAVLKGKRVSAKLTEPFRAYARPGGATRPVSHTAKQKLPIQLGTSGGWGYDLANGYCCGGTLGSLIQVNGVQYILSNYHVFEADIVPGGNQEIVRRFLVSTPRVAATGDPIIQPGLIDVGCKVTSAQTIATLVTVNALPHNNVDCSVALATPGSVRADGAILEIGPISSQTALASIAQPVKKSGRTTGLTRSQVSGLNATIQVSYEDECAGNVAFTAIFRKQIVIANPANGFLDSGDSGSLMVEDIATSPKAVGLLYAGSSTDAIANPIDEVLTFLSSRLGGTATMVGK